MPDYDKRVDEYIDKAAAFAKPILLHIRKIVHDASPLIEETMKWSCPHFDYKGPICGMVAFKEHCGLGFWKGSILPDPHGLIKAKEEHSGQFGKITSVADLPADEILIAFIREAIKVNEAGIKVKKVTVPKATLVIPDYFTALLQENPVAMNHFEKMSTSQKRDYVDWFTDAKTETTRQSRLKTAMEQISEGKPRHWKYK